MDQLLEQHIKELAERGSPEIGESPLLEAGRKGFDLQAENISSLPQAEKDQGGTVLSFLKEQRSRHKRKKHKRGDVVNFSDGSPMVCSL